MSGIFQLPPLLGEWELKGPVLLARPLATVPPPSYVSVHVNGISQAEGVDYGVTGSGCVYWLMGAPNMPVAGDHILIRAWESEPPPPPPVRRISRPTILCSRCGEPMTPGDPRRRRRAKAKPASGYRCHPCGREVRP